MKTFEQFLNEAQRPAFASQREIPDEPTPEEKAKVTVSRLQREREQKARDAAKKEREDKGLPPGTSPSLSQQDIARQRAVEKAQLAAQEAEQKAKQEAQNTLSQAAQRLAALKASETPEQKAAREKNAKARARSERRAARKAK